jgi:hypothetical protein
MKINSLLISSIVFALYITCPRMTGMIATQAKTLDISPYYMIALGSVLGIPAFWLLYHVLSTHGVEAAVLTASALDMCAALILGSMSVKSGVELFIITLFVYIGMRVAPLVASLLL